MAKRILAIAAGVCALAAATPAVADRYGDGTRASATAAPNGHALRFRRHDDARRMRVLPPRLPYRDPRFAAPPRRPDFLIHAYLPRDTDKPIYNEPPPRFPAY